MRILDWLRGKKAPQSASAGEHKEKKGEDFSDLVRSPLSANLCSDSESIFLPALQLAVTKINSGDMEGLEALRNAIRYRAKNRRVKFYRPGVVLMSGDDADNYFNAQDDLRKMIAQKALLDDVERSGQLIYRTQNIAGFDELVKIVRELLAEGRLSDAWCIQLIQNEITSTAKLGT